MANIIRLDLISIGTHARSFVCEEQDLERGLFLNIVGKANNIHLDADPDYEAYKVELAKAGNLVGNLMLNTTIPNQYDERKMEKDFVLEAGRVGRGHMIHRGDIVTIPTVEGVEVGALLGLDANGLLAEGGEPIAVVEALEDITIPFYGQQYQGLQVEDLVQPSMVIRFL